MSRLSFRPARRQDATTIAALFRISSDGVADYIWSRYDCPGMSLLAIGAERYSRENTAFSYQNCVLAACDGRTVGMLHSYPIPADSRPDPVADPVLRAASELELPGSLYISSLSMFPAYRGRGIGSRLLGIAERKARKAGLERLSLICFEANRDALRLYRRHGFEELDRRPIQPHPLIHTTGDALLLGRELAPDRCLANGNAGPDAIAA